MSAEKPHKENTGVLYPKGQKWIAEKPGRPTHEGEVTILCPECSRSFRKRIVAWSKENQFGWFQTLAFNEANKRQPAAPAAPDKTGGVS